MVKARGLPHSPVPPKMFIFDFDFDSSRSSSSSGRKKVPDPSSAPDHCFTKYEPKYHNGTTT
eukprot:16317036-Heterocapsa_arctica.AAC.1